MTTAPLNLHGSTVVVGEHGVLIRGPSGSGKSRLALALVSEAQRDGRFARVVADDRTLVATHAMALVARPHPAVAGRIERRGLGIVAVNHEPACRLDLVVDLSTDADPARWPLPPDSVTVVGGVPLPRLVLTAREGTADQVALVFDVIAALTTSS